MRNALVVAILVATAACGAYRFPGEAPNGTGTVSGQVTTVSCVIIEAPTTACIPRSLPGCATTEPPVKGCNPGPIPCAPPPGGPGATGCGTWPVPGFELDFTNGNTIAITKTDGNGKYSLELAAGTWTVSTKNYMRIASGPQTVIVSAGASVVADYVVDSGIR